MKLSFSGVVFAVALIFPVPVGAQMPQNGIAGTPLDCINNAVNFGLLSQQDAIKLCAGSPNSGPYDCYREAERQIIDPKVALPLCRCALSTSRVSCFTQAQATTSLSPGQILDLCTHDAAAYNNACNSAPPR